MKRASAFFVLTSLVLSCATADAGWWWSSSGRSSSVRSYRSNDAILFPEQNTVILRQNLGSGLSVYSSGPFVQYGANAPIYVPQQQPMRFGIPQNLNTGIPAWVR